MNKEISINIKLTVPVLLIASLLLSSIFFLGYAVATIKPVRAEIPAGTSLTAYVYDNPINPLTDESNPIFNKTFDVPTLYINKATGETVPDLVRIPFNMSQLGQFNKTLIRGVIANANNNGWLLNGTDIGVWGGLERATWYTP